ncbi:hypothetical protein GGR51DRAFT_574019 [Nemania sp. FL0031]|nr:hypothetical protein GGR51DRAFT_574019 [Nemania sp. FL0031]
MDNYSRNYHMQSADASTAAKDIQDAFPTGEALMKLMRELAIEAGLDVRPNSTDTEVKKMILEYGPKDRFPAEVAEYKLWVEQNDFWRGCYERDCARGSSRRIEPDTLLESVVIANHSARNDQTVILEKAQSSFEGEDEMGCESLWLMTTKVFRDWRYGRSSIMFVDGCRSKTGAPITLTSVAFANASDLILKAAGNNIVLSFYAEKYCDTQPSASNENGPKALMRSLISQLLQHYTKGQEGLAQPDLAFLTPEYLGYLALRDSEIGWESGNYDLHRLCQLFFHLVYNLPPTFQLFCIIDSIFLWEQEPWLEDLKLVVSRFRSLVFNHEILPGESASLKFLLGGPDKSTELVGATDFDSRVDHKYISLEGYEEGYWKALPNAVRQRQVWGK